MLPTPSQLSSIDPRASRLLYHIRKHMERDGIRGATQQTIALRVTWWSGLANWFAPLIESRTTRAQTVKEANRSMYATGWQIKKASIKRQTQRGNYSYNDHLHLQMDFDPARMTPGAVAARQEEERQAAISELQTEMDALRAKMEAIRAA
jgi:hypothetical protein